MVHNSVCLDRRNRKIKINQSVENEFLEHLMIINHNYFFSKRIALRTNYFLHLSQ
jgi:hypothetical protein